MESKLLRLDDFAKPVQWFFPTFSVIKKNASQTATILDTFQVCFQTRSAWHRSLPSIQGRFRVPHWWCDVSHILHARHQPTNISFLCTNWLIFSGVELGIQMESLLVISMISRHLLSTEVMDFLRVEHAIHGRWYQTCRIYTEKAIEIKLVGLKDAKIESKIPNAHGNLVMILAILRSYAGLGTSWNC